MHFEKVLKLDEKSPIIPFLELFAKHFAEIGPDLKEIFANYVIEPEKPKDPDDEDEW